MKNKTTEKPFDTVKVFRKIKEEISNDLAGKSTEEILEYIRKNSGKMRAKHSSKR